MYNIITIGDPVIDTHVQIADKTNECRIIEDKEKYLSFRYGAKIPIVDSFQTIGGNAPNVAIGCAKLGLSSAIISTIGDGSNGRMVLDFLKKFNVDSSFVTMEHDADTRYSIVLNYQKERTILSYSQKKNYIWPEPVPATDWVYYTGLSEGYETVHEKLLAYLDSHPGVRLAINPGSYMLKYALPALKEAVAQADLLIVNLEEAEAIAGHTKVQEKNETALLNDLLALGVAEVVLTDGMRGAWAATKEGAFHIEPYPVTVVAKTGAGDAFAAGYIAARHYSHDIPHALEWGCANSAGVVGAHGQQAGMLDQKGLAKIMEKFPEVKSQHAV